MKIQQKSAFILTLLLICLFTFIIVYGSTILLSKYNTLETNYINDTINKAANRLYDESTSLSAIVADWGPWDDTYNFVLGNKPDFVEANIVPSTFRNLRLNFIVIANKTGKLVYSGAYNSKKEKIVPLPDSLKSVLNMDNPLLNMSNPQYSKSGILILPDGPVIAASWPIIHSNFSGTPEGVVIMGRYLDNAEILRLSALTQPNLGIHRLDDPNLPDGLFGVKTGGIINNSIRIAIIDDEHIAGYALIPDIYNKNGLVLSIFQERDIYHEGLNTTLQFIFIIICAGIIFGIICLFLLNRLILSRLSSLGNQVHGIGRESDLSRRVAIKGDDELADLVGEINHMLSIIEQNNFKLQTSELRFRELSDLLPQIIFEMEPSGKLTYVNKYGLEVFEISEVDVVKGRNAREFLIKEDVERMYSNLEKISEGERSKGELFTLIKNNKKIIRALVVTAPIRHNGMLQGFRGSVIDITDRLRLEEALIENEEKYRALAENTPDVLFSLDMNGTITYASPQVNQYGYLIEEVTGKELFSFIHPEERKTVKEKFFIDIDDHAQFKSTIRMLDKWRNINWFEIKCSLRLNQFGKPFGVYGILRDVSERKRGEDAIELANKKLNLMNNITRHDILNTLTGLYGLVDIADAISSDRKINDMLNDIRNLVKLIQRNIEFTREYQEVGVRLPIWQNLTNIITDVRQNFEKSGVKIYSDLENIEIFADPLLVKVIFNLIDNAIRYGEKINKIHFYYYVSDYALSLFCEDDGVGVAYSQKEQIFERGIGRNTGMGLFLSREILGITGITIEENGKPEVGARFEIQISSGTFHYGR